MDMKYFKSKDNQIDVRQVLFHNVSCTPKKASNKLIDTICTIT